MKVTSFLIESHIFRIVNNNLEYLLLKRAESEVYPFVWQMVTGSIKEGEKAWETALREMKEETGLVPEEFWVVPYTNSFYSHERNEMCLVPVFAARVNKESIVTISDEHSEYKWVRRQEAKKLLAWYGQRKSVDIIDEYVTKEKSKLEFTKLVIR